MDVSKKPVDKKSTSNIEATNPQSKSNEIPLDKRLVAKSSAFEKPQTKLTFRGKQLIDDYSKLYKEYQELGEENARLQAGIARYFKEHLSEGKDHPDKKQKHHTKEESERHAEDVEIEHERRFESGFKVMKDLNKKIIAAKEDAQRNGEMIKNMAVQKEIEVQIKWKNYCSLQNRMAKQATYRKGHPLELEIVERYFQKIEAKLAKWRVVGMKGKMICIRKYRLEERLRALDNFGGNLSLNHYDELKAISRLHQERNEKSIKELEAARIKHSHGSQIAAHLSEKVSYLKVLKKELVEKIEWMGGHLAQERERLNHVKMQRDHERKIRQGIKDKTGIMYSSNLLHDLEKKIAARNAVIRDLTAANDLFLNVVANTKDAHLTVDPVTHMRNMSRGNLPLLPESIESEQEMDIICNYDGKHDNAEREFSQK